MWTPLVMTRGDSRTFTITLTTDGFPLDLTDADVWFTVAGVFSKRLGAGITVDDPTTGVVVVAVDPADTEQLPGRVSTRFDLQVKLADGTVSTPRKGRFVIVPDATRTTV